MVFGLGQRQETGFVIAGYVLAKEQRGLTSDYKRFPLPSSPAKGRRRCCLGLEPETRKRKSPENQPLALRPKDIPTPNRICGLEARFLVSGCSGFLALASGG